MNLLIDTHTALWWFDDPGKLSNDAAEAIAEPRNRVFLSAAAAWEIAIKRSLGKLKAPSDLQAAMAANRILPLVVSIADAMAVEALPPASPGSV